MVVTLLYVKVLMVGIDHVLFPPMSGPSETWFERFPEEVRTDTFLISVQDDTTFGEVDRILCGLALTQERRREGYIGARVIRTIPDTIVATYPLFVEYFRHGNRLPYVISRGRVRWNLMFPAIKPAELCESFGIDELPMQGYYERRATARPRTPEERGISFGTPPEAWRILEVIAEQWQAIYPILDEISTVLGLGATVVSVASLIKKKRSHERIAESVPPAAVFGLILSKDGWTADELAKLLEADKDYAKALLTTCRYQWNVKKQKYEKSADSMQFLEQLNNRASKFTFGAVRHSR